MKKQILESISVGVIGNVKGFRYVGESLEEAAARCVFEVETHANATSNPRLHLDIKKESEPESGQSRLAATLAKRLLEPISVNPKIRDDKGGIVAEQAALLLLSEFARVIDTELQEIRDAFAELKPCPIITHHPEGPCAFCAGYALRDVLLLKDVSK